MQNRSLFSQIPPFIRRLTLPVVFGLLGIFITISIAQIPHSYSTLILLAFLFTFGIAHVFWLNQVIQTLRQDLKTSVEPSEHISPRQPRMEESSPKIDLMVEASFLQLLRDRLNVPHPPHFQAHSLPNDKTQVIQTSGIIPLLRENQLEILTQPIVNLPQKRLSFFSCVPSITIENGMLINLNTLSTSSHYFQAQQAIDRMVLFQTLQFVRRHLQTHPNYRFICWLSPTIFKDHNCLGEITEFLEKSHFPFQGLIFEVPLTISESSFTQLSQLKHHGVRFIGKWDSKDLPVDLADLPKTPVDYINLPFPNLSTWLQRQPHKHSLECLHQIHEISPQTIITHVDKEQDLYQQLPIPFDFAAGKAFGLTKPFYHIKA